MKKVILILTLAMMPLIASAQISLPDASTMPEDAKIKLFEYITQEELYRTWFATKLVRGELDGTAKQFLFRAALIKYIVEQRNADKLDQMLADGNLDLKRSERTSLKSSILAEYNQNIYDAKEYLGRNPAPGDTNPDQ